MELFPFSYAYAYAYGVISGIGRKWKRSDSFDSDSVEVDSAYDSVFRFSQGHKRSYDSDQGLRLRR